MFDTTITIYRAGVILTGTDGRQAIHVRCQVDQASDKEVIDLHQIYEFQSNYVYKIYVPWAPNALILQKDILQDEQFADPDRAGVNLRYKIIGRPKNYPYDHQQCYGIVEVGT